MWQYILGGFGVVFLVILLVLGFIAFRIWRSWRRLKTLGGLGALMTPREINLHALEQAPDWAGSEEVQGMIAEAARWGLVPGACYEVEEMEGVTLMPLVADGEGPACGVIYDHPQAGNWLDLVVMYVDGAGLTVTNAPMGHELDQPPGREKIFLEDVNAAELFQEMMKRFVSKPSILIRQENFVEVFEQAYREEMEWRVEKGTTEEEVRRVAANMDGEVSDDDIRTAVNWMESERMEELTEQCRSQFIKVTSMSVAEWIEVEDELFFLSDRFTVDQALGLLDDYLEFTEVEAARFKEAAAEEGGSVCAAFRQVNEQRPEAERARLQGWIEEPVPAEVYAASREEEASLEAA